MTVAGAASPPPGSGGAGDSARRRGPAAAPAKPARSAALERLSALALLVGLIAAVSWATGAMTPVRAARPALGAWLAARQFNLMVGGATAFGLLAGIRAARRCAGRAGGSPAAAWLALAAAAVALAPLTPLCAAAARLGPRVSGAAMESLLVGWMAYQGGERALKIVIAIAYCARIAVYAAIAGAALFAIVVAAAIVAGRAYPSAGS